MVIAYRISGSELADICEFPNAEAQFGPEDVAKLHIQQDICFHNFALAYKPPF